MDGRQSHVVRAFPACEGPLLSLGDGFAGRFHSWHGTSGQRYVTSVFAVDPMCPDLNLPVFEACIVVPVAREGQARRMLGVIVVERESERRAAVAQALARPAYEGQAPKTRVDEWHVHLLAADRRRRAAVAADLRARLDEVRGALLA